MVDSLGKIEVLGGYDSNGNALASIDVSQELSQPDLAPTISSAPVTNVVVNTPYNYQVLSTANPQATYSLTTAPDGMTINASTGLITWTPTSLGSSSVTLQASSSVGQTSQTFAINVVLPTPLPQTGLIATGLSTTAIRLSWSPSPDPNVTSYNVYRRTFLHDPKGSGGSYYYSRVASNVTSTSVTISGTSVAGTYLVSTVNSAGMDQPRSASVSAQVSYRADPLWHHDDRRSRYLQHAPQCRTDGPDLSAGVWERATDLLCR